MADVNGLHGSAREDRQDHNTYAAIPLSVKNVQQLLNLEPLFSQVDKLLDQSIAPFDSDDEAWNDGESGERKPGSKSATAVSNSGGTAASSQSRHSSKKKRPKRVRDSCVEYNFSQLGRKRQWLEDMLLSDSSGSSEDEILEDDCQSLLQLHKLRRYRQGLFHENSHLRQYQFYSAGVLCDHDPFVSLNKSTAKPKASSKESKAAMKAKIKKMKLLKKQKKQAALLAAKMKKKSLDERKKKRSKQKELDMKRQRVWSIVAKKDVPRMQRQFSTAFNTIQGNCRKIAQLCQKEVRKEWQVSQKASKETIPRARRLTKEMLIFWKRFDKVEREHRRRAEKEAMEQRKQDEELREAKRQQRKLNFLITQTELYAHFIGKKLSKDKDEEDGEGGDASGDAILEKLDDGPLQRRAADGTLVTLETAEDYDAEAMKAQALANVQHALNTHEAKTKAYSGAVDGSSTELQDTFDMNYSLANPSLGDDLKPQPKMFRGKLKVYQLKGMNWLANLYDQGINGILADEMGLGKTVQSISLLAHLSENQNTWGPFLVVAPASTLHNWQQEVTRFVPDFKVLPYWGNPNERKTLRKFWTQSQLYRKDAPFHVLITSYQLIISDVKYFQRIKWQYMILDEAQAIKSSASVRWKILLGFNCRNRLLLTGTPIQNSMAELWALLHFIMPTLFDSHAEFDEWFSKDIENSVEKKSSIDQHQLSRLHMILKPFMLRRIKKDVENEMAEKIELEQYCTLSRRQQYLYRGIRQLISLDELLHHSTNTSSTSSSLMNLVMQFRKVCNHPELFERREVVSPLSTSVADLRIPRLLFEEGLLSGFSTTEKSRCLERHSLLKPDCLHRATMMASRSHGDSSLGNTQRGSNEACDLLGSLSLLRETPSVCSRLLLGDFNTRMLQWAEQRRLDSLQFHRRTFEVADSSDDESIAPSSPGRESSCSLLNVRPHFVCSREAVRNSPVLGSLVFASYPSPILHHATVHIRPLRSRSLVKTDGQATPPNGDTQQDEGVVERQCVAMPAARFLHFIAPKIVSTVQPYCYHRQAAYRQQVVVEGGEPERRNMLMHYDARGRDPLAAASWSGNAALDKGLHPLKPKNGWSHIHIPNKDRMICDSGKLTVLDKLLKQLKIDGHRVLIYSQMTKMIDLLEEFIIYRKYKYMRLDGSSKIADRRDMVADFQARDDIFVFLLSTRAGGLGINLTAADTVVFYDSDWNPTVDQQAMDRAHRLGQTKQVTVYRLITKGTVEERILERAKEKSEIHRMVISGGQFKPDVLKPTEVVSLLLDNEEMERNFKERQSLSDTPADAGTAPAGQTAKGTKRKNSDAGASSGKKKFDATLSSGGNGGAGSTSPAHASDSPALPGTPNNKSSSSHYFPTTPVVTVTESTNKSVPNSSEGSPSTVGKGRARFSPAASPASRAPGGRPRGGGRGRGSRRGRTVPVVASGGAAAAAAGAAAGAAAAAALLNGNDRSGRMPTYSPINSVPPSTTNSYYTPSGSAANSPSPADSSNSTS
ncbi:chromatin-remodeling ATPase INO80-like [Sycon ciliatum]|uniref:chromatin-remodeling ATPase INO80-like n=1 Tax=Sycon ciliatum TaxID=27933 RepID=UPI0031F5F5F4